MLHSVSDVERFLTVPGERKMDVRFVALNVRSLHRSDHLESVEGKSTKYKLNSVEAPEIGWKKAGAGPPDDYSFFCRNRNGN
jgi:hypothetical protein